MAHYSPAALLGVGSSPRLERPAGEHSLMGAYQRNVHPAVSDFFSGAFDTALPQKKKLPQQSALPGAPRQSTLPGAPQQSALPPAAALPATTLQRTMQRPPVQDPDGTRIDLTVSPERQQSMDDFHAALNAGPQLPKPQWAGAPAMVGDTTMERTVDTASNVAPFEHYQRIGQPGGKETYAFADAAGTGQTTGQPGLRERMRAHEEANLLHRYGVDGRGNARVPLPHRGTLSSVDMSEGHKARLWNIARLDAAREDLMRQGLRNQLQNAINAQSGSMTVAGFARNQRRQGLLRNELQAFDLRRLARDQGAAAAAEKAAEHAFKASESAAERSRQTAKTQAEIQRDLEKAKWSEETTRRGQDVTQRGQDVTQQTEMAKLKAAAQEKAEESLRKPVTIKKVQILDGVPQVVDISAFPRLIKEKDKKTGKERIRRVLVDADNQPIAEPYDELQ